MAKILLSIGSDSGDQLKRWTWWNWINLARLIAWHDHQVAFVGATEDEIPNIETKTYAQLKAVLQTADLVIGNDNGIVHVADYLNIPTIMLVGPTNALKNITLHGIVIKGQCPKGFQNGCYKNGSVQCAVSLPCLAAITPPQVYEEIDQMVRNKNRIIV